MYTIVVTMIRLRLARVLVVTACALSALPVQAADVSIPSSPPNNAIPVQGNFLGVSFELSAFDKYCECDLGSYSTER